MPKPQADDTEESYMDRCIPQLIDEGKPRDQAIAICGSMWNDRNKSAMPQLKTLTMGSLEVKTLGDREIEGHGAVFGNVDLGGDIIVPGAFKATLKDHKKAGTWPQMYWMHDPSRVPGMWTHVEETSKGLYVRGTLADTELGREMRVLAGMKAVRGLSIGYAATEVDYKDDVRLLKSVTLYEVSMVSLAMNPLAEITGAKSRISAAGEYVPTERELETLWRSWGCSKATARELIYDLKSRLGGMPGVPTDRRDADHELVDALKRLLGEVRAAAIKR